MAAEVAGDLIAAARLHGQNHQPERAGRLYERAAYEGSVAVVPPASSGPQPGRARTEGRSS